MDVEAGRGNISVRRLADLAAALQTTAADLVTPEAGAGAPRPIALLGLRGAGKTTIGRRLARRLKRRFVELDRQVELRAGLTLSEIFSLHGEEYYRRLEREALVDLLALHQAIIVAVGGGLVTSPDTFALLRRDATTVWLKARSGGLLEPGDPPGRSTADRPASPGPRSASTAGGAARAALREGRPRARDLRPDTRSGAGPDRESHGPGGHSPGSAWTMTGR